MCGYMYVAQTLYVCSTVSHTHTPLPLHRHVPAHASKEVVVVMGALTSQDPGNISSTIDVRTYLFIATRLSMWSMQTLMA